ncbi:MAG: bifunctional tRNA (5-methylaminomethyl-2-thiouridine)(34)-methyltransferase MnmD/FAD-dependent 5-carboxymethylaminomethyl-2-thiouridine(34) oxidoreductase MnmC [Parahaliea sp.]
MPRPNLNWSEDGTPFSDTFGDIYYSRENGLAESRHVFLAGNQLPARWFQHSRTNFVIAETGFGTGLNFLLTWQAWAALPQPKPRLHFISIEQYPLRKADIAKALSYWPELADYTRALLKVYPEAVAGVQRLLLAGGELTLDLWWAEAGAALADMADAEQTRVDAWYLDGFAPARNAAMWDQQLLTTIGRLSHEDATVATFTAAGSVRRALQNAGFEMHKSRGFGRKREQLQGRLKGPRPTHKTNDSPWHLPAEPSPPPQSVLVLGAGMAGCASAAAFARRGLPVTLLEQHTLAGAASGNRQGVLYTRLSPRHSSLADFALLSYQFAHRHFSQLFASSILREGIDGALCGSFHQQKADDQLALMKTVLKDIPELAAVLDSAEANTVLGIDQSASGYWFPGSGWLHPPAVCRAWASHPGITLRENCGPLLLQQRGRHWQALDDTGAVIAEADCVVIACAASSRYLAELDWLPLQSIRGQTTYLPAGIPFARLQAVLCHEGYITPSDKEHCIGATFNLNDSDSRVRASDHRDNLDQLAQAVPAWATTLNSLDENTLAGRTGFRCASPDYLPLAGPVPDLPVMCQRFAALRHNARQQIPQRGAFIPGLYLNVAHGSRGLTSAPLAAELIASLACNEALPLSRRLGRALAPARFIIRNLGRNRL